MIRRAAILLFLLSAASGAIDAVSFIVFKVFTSAMTGNTALLGIAIARQQSRLAIDAGVSLAGYMLGVLVATPLSGRNVGRLRPVLLLEVLALAGFAWLAVSHGTDDSGSWTRAGTIALAALGMGAQAVAAREVNAPSIITVVFTSTLTAITEALAGLLFGTKKKSGRDTMRQVGAFVSYLLGAAAGGALSRVGIGAVVPLVCAAAALLLESVPHPSASSAPSATDKERRGREAG